MLTSRAHTKRFAMQYFGSEIIFNIESAKVVKESCPNHRLVVSTSNQLNSLQSQTRLCEWVFVVVWRCWFTPAILINIAFLFLRFRCREMLVLFFSFKFYICNIRQFVFNFLNIFSNIENYIQLNESIKDVDTSPMTAFSLSFRCFINYAKDESVI